MLSGVLKSPSKLVIEPGNGSTLVGLQVRHAPPTPPLCPQNAALEPALLALHSG